MAKKTSKLKSYADFLFEVGVLERTPRSGLKRHLGDAKQSVSEHLLRTAYVGLVLASLENEKGEKLDVGKVIETCLYHDLGEARVTDLDYVSKFYVTRDEIGAIRDATDGLPFQKRILDLYRETKDLSTKEGILAKDADNIELLLSLKEIMENGNRNAKEWIPSLFKRLHTKTAKDLGKMILKTNGNDWWMADIVDEHGVHGAKIRK